MKKRTRKNYTQEFKEEAVKLITNQGYSFAEAGRNLGVNPNVLSRWKKEIEPVASSSQAAKRQIPCNGLCKISHGKYPDHKSKKLDY